MLGMPDLFPFVCEEKSGWGTGTLQDEKITNSYKKRPGWKKNELVPFRIYSNSINLENNRLFFLK